MSYTVRYADKEDLCRIEEIYAFARAFMAQTGNPNQWGTNYPSREQLIQDIEGNTLFVMEDSIGIHGVFYFKIGKDPTYAAIYQGCWRSDTPYGTIHRIAGDGSGSILQAAVSFASSKISHIRIDTHQDNLVMQKALQKQGFQKRGIIYLADNSSRLAYDKLVSDDRAL